MIFDIILRPSRRFIISELLHLGCDINPIGVRFVSESDAAY